VSQFVNKELVMSQATSEPVIPRVFHDGWADFPADHIGQGWDEVKRTYGTFTSTEICSLLTGHVLGRVLTAIDASALNARQSKAVKDTIKNLMWDTYQRIHSWMCDNAHKDGTIPFPYPWNEGQALIARN
jgi:hypothetical protein